MADQTADEAKQEYIKAKPLNGAHALLRIVAEGVQAREARLERFKANGSMEDLDERDV